MNTGTWLAIAKLKDRVSIILLRNCSEIGSHIKSDWVEKPSRDGIFHSHKLPKGLDSRRYVTNLRKYTEELPKHVFKKCRTVS